MATRELDNFRSIYGPARELVRGLLQDMENDPCLAGLTLDAMIFMQITKLLDTADFGKHYYRINTFSLDTTQQAILEREPTGLVREVFVVVDSAAGGPLPTIRYGPGSVTPNAGARLIPGQRNELGMIEANVRLNAVSSAPIQIYVIEIA